MIAGLYMLTPLTAKLDASGAVQDAKPAAEAIVIVEPAVVAATTPAHDKHPPK